MEEYFSASSAAAPPSIGEHQRAVLKWMVQELLRTTRVYDRAGWGPQDLIDEIRSDTVAK